MAEVEVVGAAIVRPTYENVSKRTTALGSGGVAYWHALLSEFWKLTDLRKVVVELASAVLKTSTVKMSMASCWSASSLLRLLACWAG